MKAPASFLERRHGFWPCMYACAGLQCLPLQKGQDAATLAWGIGHLLDTDIVQMFIIDTRVQISVSGPLASFMTGFKLACSPHALAGKVQAHLLAVIVASVHGRQAKILRGQVEDVEAAL